ncbi:hypothetical protein [Rhizomonospora bruguierae]|uniref:hypothetical protein n=1 Tax=Rhizomonospora bruguierae TaxID=1581705 RepID=UPI001BCFDD53|nr:hypothetical protein [Micromonospora sp. NBRC 107566]
MGTADGELLAASLGERLGTLTFAELTTDQVTARLIETAAGWAADRGWRVYRRAPSVLPLPPPMDRQRSVLDVACARPDGPPIAIEVDHTHRRRTIEKLLAEAAAGRVPLWIRWGPGRFGEAPEPIHLVTFEVARRRGAPGTYARVPSVDRSAPQHSTDLAGTATPLALPLEPR